MSQNFILRHFTRLSETRTWSDGATVLIDIPREAWISRAVLRFQGTITVGAAAATAVAADSVLAAIRRIRILGNGSPIIDWTGPLAYWWASFNDFWPSPLVQPAVGIAAHAFSVFIPLGPHYNGDFSETDNLIPANGYDSLQVEITCGNTLTDFLVPDAATTLAVSATTLQLMTLHHVPGPSGAARRLSTERQTRTVSAASTDTVTYFRTRDVLINGILVRQVSDNANVDTVVTSTRIVAGGYEVYPWNAVAHDRGFNNVRAQQAIPTGYLYYPFKLEGKTLESIRANAVNGVVELHAVEAAPGVANSYDVCIVTQSEQAAAVSAGAVV